MWKQIGAYAAELLRNLGYKNKNAATTLIANMANFKCREGIYNLDYNEDFKSPRIWWQFIDNDNNLLRKIALKLFAVVPHSASCERIFSGLGWFYGNRRQNLSVSTIESMAKIRHFYLTNTRNELQYSGKNCSDEELSEMLKKSNLFDEDELEEDKQDNNLEFEILSNEEIPQHEVVVLIMTNDIDLTVFDNESEDTNNELELLDKESDKEDLEEYDINEIINNVSFN